MPEKKVYIENIGIVTLRKNKRSKNVSISIRPSKGISVTIPYFLSYKYGLKVVERKRNWIEKHLPKIKEYEKNKPIFTENSEYNTRYRKLIVSSHSSEKLKSTITSESIKIFYPQFFPVENEEIQNYIKKIIIKTLRTEAKEYLPKRTEELAQKLGFRYNQVFIKNNKTLWGSCSGKNNINLNLHLLKLPSHLIDYVIIHELCHTIEKNHGPGFWKLMDSILVDAKSISKELKKYTIGFTE